MRLFLLAFLLLALIFTADSAAPRPPGANAARWKKIDQLLSKEQTATAAPLVDAIYRQAQAENNASDYVRALLYKVRLLQNKEEDDTEKAIALFEAELKTAGFPARPILHSLLAGLYTNYLDQNRYRLYERTAGATPSTTGGQSAADAGTGLATWDMGRLGTAIVRHYYQSVEDEPQKQLRTTLAALGDLAVGGDAEGRALRPTLYDLLAQRAIEGLKNQELYITRPEQQFQPTDPKLFGTAAEFAALRLLAPEADSLNGQLHALHLLQRLTASRQQLAPANLAALADVDLSRTDYLHSFTQNTDLAAQYEPALVRLAETYKALPISTEFMARRAQAAREKDPAAAVRLAREAEARFPKSRGAARARQLREEVERPELTFSAADIVVPNQPWPFSITSRNVKELHAWAYRITLKEWEGFGEYDRRNRSYIQTYARGLKNAAVATWTLPAPANAADYKNHQVGGTAPALPPGHYLVIVSTQRQRPTEAEPGSATSYGVVGASELSALYQRNQENGAIPLLLLHRQTGAPLAGVQAQAMFRRYDRKAGQTLLPLPGKVMTTPASGEVALAGDETDNATQNLMHVRVWRGADTLLLRNINSYYRGNQDSEPDPTCYLFTDRAIYRPGQTVYFKGILVERNGNKTRLLTKTKQEVELNDANGDTVGSLNLVTNEFGSFHGSFVLPAGRLNGEFTLSADDGELRFAVEDYKRPTFFVTLDSVPGRPQLGQPVQMRGRARAYSGQNTDGASVTYRVTRRELWPVFGYDPETSRFSPMRGGTKEIAHGTATTDAEGRFTIEFTPPLVPKQSSWRGWEPGHLFEVTADVTDAAGETRTGNRAVVMGRNPVSLRLTGPEMADKQRLPSFRLLGVNATGEPVPVAGTLRLLARKLLTGAADPLFEEEPAEAKPELVRTLPFDTNTSTALDLKAVLAGLPTGRYRLQAQVPGSDSAQAQLDFTLYDSEAATLPYATPDWFQTVADSVAPGQPAFVLLGSSEADSRVLLEVERGGRLLRKEWLLLPAGQQQRLRLDSGPATANGPLYVHTTQVRNNRLYRNTGTVQVAEPPQPLQLQISTFRNRLEPGQRETWRIAIRQANGRPAEAELLATLYDQSLDIFRPHSFAPLTFDEYYQSSFGWQGLFGRANWIALATQRAAGGLEPLEYPRLYAQVDIGTNRPQTVSRALSGRAAGVRIRSAPVSAAAPMQEMASDSKQLSEVVVTGLGLSTKRSDLTASVTEVTAGRAVDLSGIKARTDFRETALWEPALRTDKNGDVVLEFQMPEAVTRWQLLALAHDRNLRTGQLARQLVTQKQVQITPNAPRFFRQGDTFIFPAKFSNLTDQTTTGTAQLFLLDAATGQDLTSQLLKSPAQQAVSAGAHQSAALGWEISLPGDFAPVALTYRVVARTGAKPVSDLKGSKPKRKASKPDLGASKSDLLLPKSDLRGGLWQKKDAKLADVWFSDGEENTLPVLPNRILITESLPLPIVGPTTRTFELQKLTSTSSPTRRNHSLTLEMTANPAWYAVQSLPYLLEYPYECSEQVFSRLYANLLAAHILRSNPRFKTVLSEWQRQAQNGTAAQQNTLSSKLAQNQELKNLLLQETPWVRDAQGETERLARLTELFDEARLQAETSRALLKLQKMQLSSGAFPWLERMPEDRYITQLIVAGFGKLKKLGAFDAATDPSAQALLSHALFYVDAQLGEDHHKLRFQKGVKLGDNHLTDLHIQALYARSFWPAMPRMGLHKPAYDYYLGQAAMYWPAQNRYLQAQIGLTLFRESKLAKAAQDILRALSENALHSPELGMYWKEVRGGYYWHEARTETQATLIEAFDEVKNDQRAVDEMKLWLLKQKQTHNWESTRATADACYALLLRGSDWLTSTRPLQIAVGGQAIRPEPAQAGTGYFKTSWPAADVKPEQGKVTVAKPDAGVAWGALYWQYFEDLDKVTPAATPLSLERQLYRETQTAGGSVLEKLTAATPLKVGDALVVRLVLRTDRALEYVHLKDQRAAGLEPIAQTSGYRYQNGLGYYESPRDAATNFFLGELPRGTHVFEYRLRAAQAGDFSGGLSQVQCLYAPEFGAHSAGVRLRVAAQVREKAK